MNRSFTIAVGTLLWLVLVAATADKAPPPPPIQVEGAIADRKGEEVVIAVPPGTRRPAAGKRGELLKHFSEGIFEGWLTIAIVEVVGSEEGRITVKIREEKSVVEVDGKKVDHFVKKARVKLDFGL